MHHIFEISEVIELIFRDLPPRSTVNAACVCRAWSSVALDTLWRTVDFHHLVKLLGPLVRADDLFTAYVSFTRAPKPAEWTRFWQCALHVQHLRFSDHPLPETRTYHAITSEVPPRRHFFPQLHTIEWTYYQCSDLMLSLVPFMHEHVRCLTIKLKNQVAVTTNLQSLISAIIHRMPHLTYLNFQPHVLDEDTEGLMLELYSKLRSLQEVVLTKLPLTLCVAEGLASLESLQVVEREGEGEGEGEDEMPSSWSDKKNSDVAVFILHLREGAFSMLWKLSVEMRLDDMARLLDAKSAWERLKILTVESPIPEAPETFYAFLKAVSERCYLLRNLTVRCMKVPAKSSRRFSAEDRISFETLRPLLSCPNLVHFQIAHRNPLNIGQEDIEILAQSWTGMETLMLNMNPTDGVRYYGSNLTLRALIPLAHYCPNLRLLGLYLNSSTSGITTLEEATMMKRLTDLDVGMSSMGDAGAVALFLSRVLPLGCVLKYAGSKEMTRYGWGCSVAWACVGQSFPIMMAEKKRLTDLHMAEVEGLRAK